MYITQRQGDCLRNLIMGFEIPFRSYIANIILDRYSKRKNYLMRLEV